MEGWIERNIMFGEALAGTNGLARIILGEGVSPEQILAEEHDDVAVAKEENDIETVNQLFRLRRMNDEIARNKTSQLMDKNGRDGVFVKGDKAGQSFELKHQPQGKGREDVIKVCLAIQLPSKEWKGGWITKPMASYLIWYVGPRHFYFVPMASIRAVVARALGIDAAKLVGDNKEFIDEAVGYSEGENACPGFGYPYREYFEERNNVVMAVNRTALPGLIDLKEPTAEEEREYRRQEQEAKQRADEENARRAKEEEERRKQEQAAAKSEMDEILDANSLICPFDGTPLKWNPKKKAIRCTKGGTVNSATGKSEGGQQLCGRTTSHGAGKGGVQGSDLSRIKAKYHSDRDYQSEEIINKAIIAYKKLVFTLDNRVIPTERSQLMGNLIRLGIMANTPEQLDDRMRQGLVANGMNRDEWDILVASGKFKDVPAAEVRDRRKRLAAMGYKV